VTFYAGTMLVVCTIPTPTWVQGKTSYFNCRLGDSLEYAQLECTDFSAP
jgi:hypothetical protein